MGNKIRQVLRAYPTGPTLSVAAFWLLLHGMVTWILMSGPVSSLPSERRVVKLGLAFIGSMISTQLLGTAVARLLKLQFANPRARVLPGFAAPHLIVAGAIIAAAVAGSTATIAWFGGVSALPVAASVLLVMAGAAWSACPGPVGMLMGAATFAPLIYLFLHHADRGVAALILENNPVLIVSELCVGLASLVALGVRFSILREEMPDYSSGTLISTWTAGRLSERQGGGRTMARWGLLSRLGDAEFRLVFRHLPAWAPVRRLLLRQLNDGLDARLLAPWQFGMVLALVALQPSAPPTLHGDFGGLTLLVASLIPIFFATATLGNMALPRLYLARESLYPLSRVSLVGDLALSGACSTAILAAAHCTGVLAAVALCRAEGPLAALLLPYLALTIAQYAVVYCAIVWLALLRSVWVQAIGWFATSILSTALVTVAICSLDWQSSPSSAVLPLIVVVAIVALPIRAALVRWCRLELG